MKLTKKDKIQIAIWVGALRSGLFNQSKGRLQDRLGHCCLGVACELFTKNLRLNPETKSLTGRTTVIQDHRTNWLNQIDRDVFRQTQRGLVQRNDLDNESFKEIADLIEELYLK